ncbi:hypothetical protein KY290_001614 [Solanum tuberosum]|uniref:Uncharacterized protein n=1 Tax=Solanum tuberosum TaxID=4113 RepID=A0ABQ7WMN0_SOLTU|nr:hypothetical protein KY290_001614 [Solanum tuberosum]
MVVVWISLPRLLPDLFAKRSLLSRASAVGKPIAIDKATQDKTRPSTPRVKVILDLMGKHPKRMRLQYMDEQTGKIKRIKITITNMMEWLERNNSMGRNSKVVHVVNLDYDQASDPKIPAAGVFSGKDPSLAMIKDPGQANKVQWRGENFDRIF